VGALLRQEMSQEKKRRGSPATSRVRNFRGKGKDLGVRKGSLQIGITTFRPLREKRAPKRKKDLGEAEGLSKKRSLFNAEGSSEEEKKETTRSSKLRKKSIK